MFRAGGFMAKARRRVSTRKARKRRPRARKSHAIEVALAGLAHDIRTPLTGILALSQLLQASDLPKRERGWAEAIRGAADHLARLTTLVVDAAKADATGLVLRDEPFSPQRACAFGGEIARGACARPRHSTSTSISPSACPAASAATRCGCAAHWKTWSTTR